MFWDFKHLLRLSLILWLNFDTFRHSHIACVCKLKAATSQLKIEFQFKPFQCLQGVDAIRIVNMEWEAHGGGKGGRNENIRFFNI